MVILLLSISPNQTFDSTLSETTLFDILLDNSVDYIYIKDTKSRFIKVNKKSAWALGNTTPDEVIGKTDFDYFPDIADQTRKDEQQIMETGEPQINKSLEILFADGTKHWVSISKAPFYDKNGAVRGIVGISRDITKGKNQELKNHQQATFLSKILDTSPNCMYVKDQQGKYILANKAIADLYQTTPEEMIGRTDIDFADQAILKPVEADYFIDVDAEAIKTKTTKIVPSEAFTWNDGTKHYFYTTKTPITYHGDPNCVLGISIDITKSKQSEFALKESEQKYRSLIESLQEGIWIIDKHAKTTYVNKPMADMLGYSVNEMIDKPLSSFIDECDGKEYEKNIIQRKKGKSETHEFDFLKKNKDKIHVIIDTAPLKDENGSYKGAIAGIIDITEKQKTSEKLKKSEEKYRRLVNVSPGITYIYGSKSGAIFWSNRVKEVLGFSPDKLHKNPNIWMESIHPDDLPSVKNIIRNATISEKFDIEYRIKDANGHWHWLHDRSISIRKDNDEIIIEGLATDITNRKETEDKLKETEQRLKLKLETILSPDIEISTEDFVNIINSEQIQAIMDDFYKITNIGIGILDMKGNILVSTGWQDICTKFHRVHPETEKNCIESDVYLTQGVKPGEYKAYKCKNNMWDIATPIVVGGKRFGTIFLGQFFYEDEQIDYAFFEKQADHYGFDKNGYLTALKNVPRWKKETVTKVMDFYSKFAEMIAQLSLSNIKLAKMIEKHRQSEDELNQAHQQLQRMNKKLEQRVNQRTNELEKTINLKDNFICQLGHDLKTPLGPLLNLIPILKNKTEDQQCSKILTVLERNVNYMRGLVDNTLKLAQLNSPKYTLTFEKTNLIKEIIDATERNKPLFDSKNIILQINGEHELLSSVDKLMFAEVMNNLLNNAVKYSDENTQVSLDAHAEDDNIIISIKDEGAGISEKDIDYVFDEYFKADSARHDFTSNGLGLPICKRIIEKHGGKIWVESSGLGKGSTFYFSLPLVKEEN